MSEEIRTMGNLEVMQQSTSIATENDDVPEVRSEYRGRREGCRLVVSFFGGMFAQLCIFYLIYYVKSTKPEDKLQNSVIAGLSGGASIMCMIMAILCSSNLPIRSTRWPEDLDELNGSTRIRNPRNAPIIHRQGRTRQGDIEEEISNPTLDTKISQVPTERSIESDIPTKSTSSSEKKRIILPLSASGQCTASKISKVASDISHIASEYVKQVANNSSMTSGDSVQLQYEQSKPHN